MVCIDEMKSVAAAKQENVTVSTPLSSFQSLCFLALGTKRLSLGEVTGEKGVERVHRCRDVPRCSPGPHLPFWDDDMAIQAITNNDDSVTTLLKEGREETASPVETGQTKGASDHGDDVNQYGLCEITDEYLDAEEMRMLIRSLHGSYPLKSYTTCRPATPRTNRKDSAAASPIMVTSEDPHVRSVANSDVKKHDMAKSEKHTAASAGKLHLRLPPVSQ